MPGCLPAGVFSLLPGRADDRTRRRSGLLAVAKKRRSEGRFDSKGFGPSRTLFVFGRFPAGGSPSSDPERANEKTLSGHGDMGRRVDGKSTVPPFRTTALDFSQRSGPLGICGHVSKDDSFGHGRPQGGISTDRIAPDMRVGELRPRRPAFLSVRRNGGFEGRYVVACKPAGGGPVEGAGGNSVRYDPVKTELPAPFRKIRKVRRQSGHGMGRVRGNGRSADPIPVISPSRSGRSHRTGDHPCCSWRSYRSCTTGGKVLPPVRRRPRSSRFPSRRSR